MMPNSPFVGISLFFHLLIVVSVAILRYFLSLSREVVLYVAGTLSSLAFLFSAFISLCVALALTAMAELLVYVSYESGYSNFHLAQHFLATIIH